MDAVLKKALEKLVPKGSEIKEFSEILQKVLAATDSIIRPLKVEKTIAGSFIRDTWLADKKELDLFILFPVTYTRKRLEKTGLEIGRKIVKKMKGKYEIAYAEHPYVKGKIGEFSVDIVPCYKVESAAKIMSAVDRTPFHNKYILENLRPKMANDVRLLKQFCKAIDIYGSDIRTLGFSGYLCELLIIKYKDFRRLLNAAKKWKFGVFIDLKNHCKFEYPAENFRDQPLIVIDPTDPKRNVAASLSKENFVKFVDACKEFSRKPSLKFFGINKDYLKKNDVKNHLKKRGTELFVLEFRRPNIVDDILWSQMRKTSLRLAHLMGENDFDVFHQDVWGDEKKAYMIFEMKTWLLPEMTKVSGPPAGSERHAAEFRKKYGKYNVYIENGKLCVEAERKCRKLELLLKNFLKKSERQLARDGIRSYIAKSVAKGFRLLKSKDVEKLVEKNRGFSVFLRKYFERKI